MITLSYSITTINIINHDVIFRVFVAVYNLTWIVSQKDRTGKRLLSLMLLHKRLKNACVITLMITQQAGTEIVMK